MKKENGFVLPVVLVVISLLLAGGGLYYYTTVRQEKEEKDSKQAIEDSVLGARAQALVPAKNLQEAQVNVETSASILKNLLNRSKSEQTLIATLESQYKKFGEIISKTDSLFTDPAADPRIKIANAPVDINAKRVKINELLQAWNANVATIKSLSKSNPSSITLASLVSKAKSDLALINSFVAELEISVSNLTILNSNLSQSEIDAQKANMEIVKTESGKATAVIGSVETVAKSIETPSLEETATPSGVGTPSSSGTGANFSGVGTSETLSGSSGTPASPPVTPAPIVTEAEIEVATKIVKEAEEVLKEFEEFEEVESGGSSGTSGDTGGGSSGVSDVGGGGTGDSDGDRWDSTVTDGPELVEGANQISP